MVRRLSSILSSPIFILGIAVGFLLLFCVYPFLDLILRTFFSGPGGSLSLAPFDGVFSSQSTFKAVWNTFYISGVTALLCSVIAIPTAWLFTRTNLPYANRLRSYYCLPYAIPPYIGAIAWIYLANPTNGILNSVMGGGFFNVYSTFGLIWVMSSFFYTFVLLILLASLDRMDSSLEEAARLSGASPFRVFVQITLPLVYPALLSGALLVALAAAASFGVPALIGNPARIYLVTTKIYTFQKMGSIGGLYQASALSVILLVFAVFVLILNYGLVKKRKFQFVSGKVSRPSLIDLGKWKWPIFGAMILFLFVVFVMPVLGILYAALSKVQGVFSVDNLGFQNFYRVLFEVDETPRALWNSALLGVGAATVATAIGMLLSYVQNKTRIKGRQLIDVFASIPYATPGTVVALALIFAFGASFFGMGFSIYNTLWILGLAYIVKYLSFAIRTTGDGFSQIDQVLAEAARVSGATWWVSLKTIWFPLMKPSLVAAWFLIFMPSFSELTMTILLTGPGLETVGTVLFQLQEYGDASGGGAAVLALIVIAIVACLNGLIKRISNGKYGL